MWTPFKQKPKEVDNAKICCLEDFMMEYTLWNICFIKFLPKLEKSNKTIYIYRYIFICHETEFKIHTYIIILSIISGVDSAMSAY